MSRTIARRLERLEQRMLPTIKHVLHIFYVNSDGTKEYEYTVDPGSRPELDGGLGNRRLPTSPHVPIMHLISPRSMHLQTRDNACRARP